MNIYTIRLADSSGFFQAYEAEVASGRHKTKAEAYAAVEAQREAAYGFRKFANYNSFKNALCSFKKRHPEHILTT